MRSKLLALSLTLSTTSLFAKYADYEWKLVNLRSLLEGSPQSEQESLDADYPYYLKFCASTRVHPLEGQSGTRAGHSVFYLKGVCIDKSKGPAGLALCAESENLASQETGTGISIDKRLKNVNFFVFPGHSLFFYGGLEKGEPFDASRRRQMIEHVLDINPFEGIEHHKYPEGIEGEERYRHMAESTIGTDYGVALGRSNHCIRVPFPRGVMGQLVDHLNALNASYKTSLGGDFRGFFRPGVKEDQNYHWNAFWDNCTHTPINALAAVGVLDPREINLPAIHQLGSLAIPSNTVIDIHEAIYKKEIDVDDYFKNPVRRELFLQHRWIPQSEGAYTEFIPMWSDNSVFKKDDKLLYMPSVLKNLRKSLRKLPKDPRSALLGSGDIGLAPNLGHFLLKYEKALAKLEEKEQSSHFQKQKEKGDLIQIEINKSEIAELRRQLESMKNRDVKKPLTEKIVAKKKELTMREEALAYVDFVAEFKLFLQEKIRSTEQKLDNLMGKVYER